MRTRALGDSGLELSEVGLGTWAIGGDGPRFCWGPQDDRESVATIHRALDLGVNWIDTAPLYGFGHSEEIVGEAIAGRRSDVILATKCGLLWNDRREVISSLARSSVRHECEASLRRLKTDVIDLYQIHWPNDRARVEEAWEEIGRLMDDGMVRYAGVCNFHYDMSDMKRAQAVRRAASLQAAYSLLRRYPERSAFDYCREERVGFLAYSPMQAGLLTGTFQMRPRAENDWRNSAEEHSSVNLPINLDFVGRLIPIAAKYGATLAQFVIAWILRRPEVTSVIVGARRPSQIEETVRGTGWAIDPVDLGLLDNLCAARLAQVEAADGYIHASERQQPWVDRGL